MTPRAYVVHRLPGRLRLRLERLPDADAFYERLGLALAALPAEVDVAVNPRTRSMLFRHPPDVADALETWLADCELFQTEHGPPPRSPALAPLASRTAGLNRAISEASAGSVDLRTLLFIAVLGLALRQLIRGEVLGPALPLFLIATDLAGKVAGSHAASDAVAMDDD